MKRTLMGIVMAGAIISSGCAAIAREAMGDFGAMGTRRLMSTRGASSGGGQAMIYQTGPAHKTLGTDYHSLADPVAQRPSPASALGMASPRMISVGNDSPLVEWGPQRPGQRSGSAGCTGRTALDGLTASRVTRSKRSPGARR